ncbi:UvsX-like recombinase [Sinorhizobium phage phiM9]|uniref:Putative UvsX RecA-like protein n=1 Tax=Sinorhizobium phage phiM9 TaxID=1636182 RepID=A0A0F6TGK4_9CAUD|nr:UvsX-like recombinase [Sinorhizobium phage phiM9]AKE44639.1 putative UvsX RecA-like protein [Sinorhizobium phage phiM9]
MSELLKKLKKVSAKATETKVLAETDFFDTKYCSPSDILIFNLAVSGKLLESGIGPGVTVLSGQSKTYKTVTGINYVKAYLDKFPDAICVFYDSELGGPGYWEMVGVDMDRVLHIVIRNVEELNFDMAKKLDSIELGEKIIFFIDSIGMLASKKETVAALEENSAEDMTRAKKIKSFFRQVTPTLNDLHLPLVAINNNYASMDKYNPEAMGGGGGLLLAANNVLWFNKSKHKDANAETAVGTELAGHNFRMTVHKSRFIKEGTKLTFQVLYGQNRPNKYSGLYDLATVTGDIYTPSKGWRAAKTVDEDGRILPKDQHPKFRESDVKTDADFWENTMFKKTNFIRNAESRVSLTYEMKPGDIDLSDENAVRQAELHNTVDEDVEFDPDTGEILD